MYNLCRVAKFVGGQYTGQSRPQRLKMSRIFIWHNKNSGKLLKNWKKSMWIRIHTFLPRQFFLCKVQSYIFYEAFLKDVLK